MSKIFLPGCKVKANFKSSSEKLKAYLEKTEQIKMLGCCKVFCNRVKEDDTLVVVCNNCAAIMEESSPVKNIEFVWEIIDRDEHFRFPDYKGEKMAIQDCWRAYEKRNVQDAVRSLMKKMNIEIEELEENYENTKFCESREGSLLLYGLPGWYKTRGKRGYSFDRAVVSGIDGPL